MNWTIVGLGLLLASPAAQAIEAGPVEGFVETANGRLHYVDWGGAGEAVVLLPGLGNTAHVFDDFAHLLTDRFHVLGLTRRGFGPSAPLGKSADAATLAEDVRAVLDALGVEQAHFVGHSFAGDEITAFAARHPERTLRVVYLDAAYDRAEVRRMLAFSLFTQPKPPSPPNAGKKDRASVEAYEAYVERVHGVRWPEAEAEAALRYKSGPTLKLMMAAKPPDYRAVTAPALAIFAKQGSAKDAYPWLRGPGVAGTDVAFAAASISGVARIPPPSLNAWNWWTGRWKPFVDDQRRKFAREIPDGEVVEMDGPHYLFLARPDDVARVVREFLER